MASLLRSQVRLYGESLWLKTATIGSTAERTSLDLPLEVSPKFINKYFLRDSIDAVQTDEEAREKARNVTRSASEGRSGVRFIFKRSRKFCSNSLPDRDKGEGRGCWGLGQGKTWLKNEEGRVRGNRTSVNFQLQLTLFLYPIAPPTRFICLRAPMATFYFLQVGGPPSVSFYSLEPRIPHPRTLSVRASSAIRDRLTFSRKLRLANGQQSPGRKLFSTEPPRRYFSPAHVFDYCRFGRPVPASVLFQRRAYFSPCLKLAIFRSSPIRIAPHVPPLVSCLFCCKLASFNPG